MIARPDGLDLRCSLRSALGDNDPEAVEKAAQRQERTIDAVLRRFHDDDEERRREIVLLADEVGLGKTFVALGVAWSVLHRRAAWGLSAGPVLVVTPHAHALFRKWRREAERFVQLVAPSSMGFDVKTASTPHDLAHALKKRQPTLVIARMSAFSGRLHQLDTARMAAIHSLLHMDGLGLSMDQRLAMLSDWPGTRRARTSTSEDRRLLGRLRITPTSSASATGRYVPPGAASRLSTPRCAAGSRIHGSARGVVDRSERHSGRICGSSAAPRSARP